MADLALDAESSAEQREHLAMVKSSAKSLLAIINDILDFSKLEAGKMELDPVPFHLERELDHTARAMALRCRQKGLELRHRVGAGIPKVVVGDAGRLRQVLVNLLGNAVKCIAAGMDSYIAKPINARELIRLVEELGTGAR
jgi:signal transduction histidine kinase